MLKETHNQHSSQFAPEPICPFCRRMLANVVLRPGKPSCEFQHLNLGSGVGTNPKRRPLATLGQCPTHGLIRIDFIP